MDITAMIVLGVRDSESIATISPIDVPTAATMTPASQSFKTRQTMVGLDGVEHLNESSFSRRISTLRNASFGKLTSSDRAIYTPRSRKIRRQS
jgi:hypothetical protein